MLNIKKITALALVLALNASMLPASFAEEASDEPIFTSPYGPAFVDPMKMSDEEFYGVWDSQTNSWSEAFPGKINYSYDNGLAQMESYVKEGDYESAKAEWLYYMKNRNKNSDWATNDNISKAQLYVDNIFPDTNRLPYAGEFTVGDKAETVEVNVSDVVNESGQYSFLITSRYKHESEIVLDSRESEGSGGYAPTLRVVVDGKVKEYKAIKDSYIAPNYNQNINFGNEPYILIKESRLLPSDIEGEEDEALIRKMKKVGEAWGNATRRAYIQFDISDISLKSEIESAYIYLKGYAREGEASAIVWHSRNNAWVEKDIGSSKGITWANANIEFVSWNGSEGGIDWNNMPVASDGVNNEYGFLIARLVFIMDITGAYVHTGNEYYAYHAIRHLMDFITDTGERVGTYSALDAGIRSRQIIANYRTLVRSKSMTPDAHSAITKYIWSSINFLSFDINWRPDHNHGYYELFGMIRMVTHFPFFHNTPQWNDLIVKRAKILVNNIILPDNSYKEATTGYAHGTIDGLLQILETADEVGFDLGDEYREKVKAGMSYITTTMNPDFTDIIYGDSSLSNLQSKVKRWAEYFDDDEMLYIATSGREGTEPPGLPSRLFDSNHRMGVMKSSWAKDALSLVINNGVGDNLSHTHSDNLAITAYAYDRALLVDNGIVGYVSDDIAAWQRSAAGHSTITVTPHNPTSNYEADQVRKTEAVNVWASSKAVDFYQGTSTAYAQATHSRNVLFVKPSFWIVSDVLLKTPGNTEKVDYRQNWHLSAKKDVVMDEETKIAATNFETGANMMIVPADADKIDASLRDGYNTLIAGSLYETKYPTYKQTSTGSVSYDTILYPLMEGSKHTVSLERIPMEVDSTVATALNIQITTENGPQNSVYYLTHETEGAYSKRTFGDFIFDGKTAYIEFKDENKDKIKSATLLVGSGLKTSNGYNIVGQLSGSDKIHDLYVEWTGEGIDIITSTLEKSKMEDIVINTQGNQISKVRFNGFVIPFRVDEGYVLFSEATSIPTPTPNPRPQNPGGTLYPSKPSGGTGGASSGGAAAVLIPDAGQVTEKNDYMVFSDIENHWAKDDIIQMQRLGFIKGVANDMFAPEQPVTRAEFAAILVRMKKLDENAEYTNIFSDISHDDWYAGCVEAIAKAGIMQGDGDSFRPNDYITREEASKVLVSCLQNEVNANEEILLVFDDMDSISPWAKPYAAIALSMGILKGTDDKTFDPSANVTRAQAAVMLKRLYKHL